MVSCHQISILRKDQFINLMKTYLILYCAPAELMKRAENTSPEDAAKGMEPWKEWAQRCGEALVDLGLPLSGGISTNQQNKISKSAKDIVGYSLLRAESLSEVNNLIAHHPHLSWDPSCSLEIHEGQPLPA